MGPNGIIISPGSGTPENAKDIGICLEAIQKLGKNTPILGVCLGHQAIAHAFGGKVVQASEIMHGKASEISHGGAGIFRGVKSPLRVMRYHSLIADPGTFPTNELKITARATGGAIFALEHKKYPIYGVQFHPESIGTEGGKLIIKNFLGACK